MPDAVATEPCSSGPELVPTVKTRVAVPVPVTLVALMVVLVVPEEVGVPVIWPLLVLTERPAGSGVAPKLVGLLVAVIV